MFEGEGKKGRYVVVLDYQGSWGFLFGEREAGLCPETLCIFILTHTLHFTDLLSRVITFEHSYDYGPDQKSVFNPT